MVLLFQLDQLFFRTQLLRVLQLINLLPEGKLIFTFSSSELFLLIQLFFFQLLQFLCLFLITFL